MTTEPEEPASGGKWTPGPWEACDPGDYDDFHGDSRVILGDDMRIAVVHWDARRAETDANAHLIAAAPDLAEAAGPLVAEIALYPPSMGEDDDELVEVRLADLKALRTALRRARGGDHAG